MSRFHCLCGFAIDDVGEFGDHFGEVFTPPDDIGTDGKIHDEASREWFCASGIPPLAAFVCFCGFATDEIGELDDHFLMVFAPPDSIGTDGKKHVPIDTATPMRWRVS